MQRFKPHVCLVCQNEEISDKQDIHKITQLINQAILHKK